MIQQIVVERQQNTSFRQMRLSINCMDNLIDRNKFIMFLQVIQLFFKVFYIQTFNSRVIGVYLNP